jgi:hypothetical protein
MTVVHVGARRDALPRVCRAASVSSCRATRDCASSARSAVQELFPGRAPAGHALLTVLPAVVSTLRPRARRRRGPALRAHRSRARRRPLVGERRFPDDALAARDSAVRRRPHGPRRASTPPSALPGLTLIGNWKGGIAMPDCVRAARSAADELAGVRPTG